MNKIYIRAKRNYGYDTPAYYPVIVFKEKDDEPYKVIPFKKTSCFFDRKDAITCGISYAKSIAAKNITLPAKLIVNRKPVETVA